jgi:hypothetical protein
MPVSIPPFPNSYQEPFIQTSQFDPSYNCIAWAANDSNRWYEPDPDGDYFWPQEVPREYTIEAYIQLYQHIGYEPCDNGDFEVGYQKVAIFSSDMITASHAARQLNADHWTSKLGKDIDVSHSIFSISDGFYGHVVQFLKRLI